MNSDKRPIELKDGWEIMQSGIDKLKRILEEETDDQFNAEQYMTLYTTIYNMCTQKPPHDYSEQLYNRYKEAFEVYVHEKVLPALKRHSNEILLKEMLRRWENHKLMVRWLSRFFNYLDRYYVIRHNLPNLRDVGLICFRDNVYGEIKRDAKDAILALIEKEREGELIDGTVVKNILNIFIEVGMGANEYYERDFEEHLLAATSDYYKRKAAEWITQDSCPDYMLKAEERLKLEEARVESYLHPSTKPKLLSKVEAELLTKYEEQLLTKEHSGCAALLRDDKTEDLARMYRLFSRISKGLEPIADMFKEHVEGEGMKRVREATDAAEAKKEKDAAKGRPKGAEVGAGYEQAFVRGVIELHDKYLQYVDTCFSRSSLFHKALKEAFEAFCNKTVANSSAAELMANFCDNLLKKGGSEKLSDEAIEETLDKVVKLLAFISDKDLFAEFYRKRLSRRLLFDKSASDEHERSILSRLKQQCGAQFTSKMEGMVTDLQLARDKQQSFEDHLRSQAKQLKVDLTVTVLTTGFWPTYKAIDLALPEEMVEGVTVFGEFYRRANSNRNLTWIYTLGSCHMKGFFAKRPMELQLSTLQAALLLLFNHADELSYQEIQERLHVSDEDVARMLHSLACAKYKILTKEPEGRTIAKTDKFRFNAAFTDRMTRIKVPLPPVDEKKKVIEDVDKDRKYAIDAAIVRTMKSRKQLAHSQLVMEVVQQLTRMFRPDLKLIKKRIEDLIAREYLERDRDNQQLFRYLA